MKLGSQPRKVALLGVLLAVAVYLFYTRILSSDTPAPAPRTPVVRAAAERAPAEPRVVTSRPPLREFQPSLKLDRRAIEGNVERLPAR